MAHYQHVPHVSPEQLTVGNLLGLDLRQDTWSVARARILDVVGGAIGDEELHDGPTRNQIAWAGGLGIEVAGQSYRVAFAMVQDALWERENQIISDANLRPGDRVARERELEYDGQIHRYKEEFVISSIREDGLLYFKGTGCKCGWASKFTKVEDQQSMLPGVAP